MNRFALALLMILAADPVRAAPPELPRCTDLANMLDKLEKGYGETEVSKGLAIDGHLLIMTGNKKTGSWTLVRANASNHSCIITMGMGLEVAAQGITG